MSMKVLITCGPTWVALDNIRVISNQSTGAMGHLIAKGFHKAGFKVTVIEGPVTDSLKLPGVKVIKYKFFDELAKVLEAECAKKYDVVIHAAAVSDFKPKRISKIKIDSGHSLTLQLEPTEKLINRIKHFWPGTCLVGFKLESNLSTTNVGKITRALFTDSGCDLVVANSINKGYQGYVVNADGQILAQATGKDQVAQILVRMLQ
jgi:phosphopantothenoylcysteine decarboxylase / phosphopantothenate---cysteine ligase